MLCIFSFGVILCQEEMLKREARRWILSLIRLGLKEKETELDQKGKRSRLKSINYTKKLIFFFFFWKGRIQLEVSNEKDK